MLKMLLLLHWNGIGGLPINGEKKKAQIKMEIKLKVYFSKEMKMFTMNIKILLTSVIMWTNWN